MTDHEIDVGLNASGLTFTDPSGNNVETVTGHVGQTFKWCTAYPQLDLQFKHHPFHKTPQLIQNSTNSLLCGIDLKVSKKIKNDYKYTAILTIDGHGHTVPSKNPKVIIDGSGPITVLAVSLVLVAALAGVFVVYRQLARRGVR